MYQENSQQQDRVDLLIKQMGQLQNELNFLQEQQQDNLVCVNLFFFFYYFEKIFLIITIIIIFFIKTSISDISASASAVSNFKI
jgi:hypothetical protein